MAKEVIMPKLGNTVESCIILEWKKSEGDKIRKGEIICDVETDKATFEVEAEEDGILLKTFFMEGDDVPVLTTIAVIGEKGENIESFTPVTVHKQQEKTSEEEKEVKEEKPVLHKEPVKQINTSGLISVSPRAKKLANEKGINLNRVQGTGPDGRIIERDILEIMKEQEPFTIAAASIAKNADNINISRGSAIGGRIGISDLVSYNEAPGVDVNINMELMGSFEKIPLKGIRKRISELMYRSIQNTAQLTLNTSADAAMLLEYRKKFKTSGEEHGLNNITINDLLLFCIAKTLTKFRELNAHFLNDTLYKFDEIHLANAVDTKNGLIVPVIKNADKMSLKEISGKIKILTKECLEGTVKPDDLKGSTFTVTNLGSLGIENFTPILNFPEVAILGIGNIQLKPVIKNEKIEFVNHIGLSLTINHQVVDGAPGAKFLRELSNTIANLNLLPGINFGSILNV